MFETEIRVRRTISEQDMLARLAQSEQMREFCIQMWMQNPALAKQGGVIVQNLLTRLECEEPEEAAAASPGAGKAKQRGVSLVELIMFIVIISVALTGILLVINITTRHSADPLIHKQALAIAESLLEEVQLMPFTYCDPDDANFLTAASSVSCATTPEGIGAETIGGTTEIRLGGSGLNARFDNVSDYNTFVPGAVVDISGNAAPAGYIATIAVGNPAVGLGAVPLAETLLITVTVTGPDGVPIRLDGYRTRYAPNSGP
ncbi:MAG: prepilin-type N-terminal cleavage/methylation domain-containing protein [Sideroxyarcus sp.]|nr:prepilin-type N-terminal cleavage/methylation domain-containing protein [Sideroxyarcus sp.]